MDDLRHAIRSLLATPIVAAAAMLSLALGIGANAAMFALLDSVALKSLAVADPGRLARLSTVDAPEEGGPYSYAFYDEIRRHGDLFAGTAAYNCCGTSMLTVGADSGSVARIWVSGDFFSALGVPPELGRTIRPVDDRRGGGPDGIAAVVTDRFWRQRFGGRPDIAGLRVVVDRAPVTIVGVLPPDFLGLDVGRTIDIALPAHNEPDVMPAIPFTDDVAFLAILVRLRSDRTLQTTIDALRAVQPQIRQATLPNRPEATEWLKAPLVLVAAGRGTSTLRSKFERPLVVLLAIAALVLLIACANVANLLLARGVARRTEFAVRVALGASRWQVLRPLLMESIVLVGGGAAAGLLFARWAARAITAALSTDTANIVLDLSIDWRMVSFMTATMAFAVVVFGLAPAFGVTRVDPLGGLQERGRGANGTRRIRLANGLLVAQVAISLVLVLGAWLFVETFMRLLRAPLGFDRERVVIATITASTVPAAERNVFYHRLVRAASAVTDVTAAGGSVNPPLIGGLGGDFVASRPGTRPGPDAERLSQYDTVTPGWFAAEGIGIRAGRDFDDHDSLDAEHVMIVNEAFVRRLLSGRTDIVGTRLALTFRLPVLGDMPFETRTIVGVVGDAVYRSIRDISKPTFYLPLSQFKGPIIWTNFFVTARWRTAAPAGLTRALTEAFTSLSPDLRLRFQPVGDLVDEALVQDRLVARLSAFVGGLALLLAAIGLYGVTSYTVALQRPEIGIRLALGATAFGVCRLVLSRVAVLVGTGVLAGVMVSLWASRFVASLLYGLAPRDPVAIGGAILVLTAIAAIAGALPARRAARIDPAAILRRS